MKTIKKLFLLLIMAVPIIAQGQDVTYTFESGSNGGTSDAGASYTNMVPYNTTTLVTMENQTLATLAAPAGADGNTSLVFHGKTKLSGINMMTVDLTAFSGSADQQVVWKTYLKSATVATRAGVILRAQSTATGYSSGARQGYYFSVVGTTTSGQVSFRIGKLNTTTGVVDLKGATNATIAGFTTGPLYLRAKAVGTTLTLEYSTNGTSWTLFSGASVTDASFTSGTVQLTYGLGGGSNLDQYVDDLTITNLSIPSVLLTGNSKYSYTGSPQGPNSATTNLFSGTPTLTYSYQGIGGTSYGPSVDRPSAVGNYATFVNASYNSEIARDTLAYEILPTTADQYYTFNDDVVGSAAANTSYLGTNHAVQNVIGYMLGYKSKGKMLQPSATTAVTTLTNFGTSTNYSVIWKDYASAITQKRAVILRGDASNSVSNPLGTGTSNYGLGYMFYVNNSSTTTVQMDIRKLAVAANPTTLVSNATITIDNVNKATWYKATVNGSTLTFEYSTNAGATWTTACSATDATYTSGLTQVTGINAGNLSYSYDYFGYIDLAKNVTADDNKFIYTASTLSPTVSYPGFTSPSTTLTYTGTGSTTYGPSATAPSAVGTYSLAVSATESGATRTGTFGFEIVPNNYDNVYTFKTDGVGNTPAGISYAQGTTSGTGVVASYSGTDNGSSATALTFRPTGLGTVGSTGVADLTSIASSSSYSVTWKEYVSGNGYKKGFLLQGQAGTNGYANDLKQGYLFVVYNDATNGTKCRIYTVTSNTTLTSTDNANGSVANPASGVARWYRATVGYGLQKFEYSDNGTTWITANSTSDLTYAGLSGSTQAVYGFGAGVGGYYYDYIAAKAFTPIATTGGDWSTILASSTPNSNITISSGELVVDDNKQVASLVIAPGAKLTIAAGKTLTADVVNLKSDATGTATLVNNGTATITRATVQQYLTTGRNWYIGTPVAGATSAVFGAAGTTKLYWYDEANGTTTPWPQIVNNTTPLISMQGYVVNLAHDSTITFSGILNDGTKSITVNRTVGQTNEGFNLVTNPYASYLDWDNVTKTNLSTSLWQRTKNGSSTYVFDSYNATGRMAVDNSGRGTNKHVPPMQAFWVRVNSGQATGTLTVTNVDRSHKGSATIGTNETITDPMFKTKSANTASQSVVRLQVSNGINTDETLLYSNASAQNNFDAYDSEKMFNNTASIPEIYTVAENKELAINGLNIIPMNTEIPLGFTTKTAGSFSLKSSQFSNFEVGSQIIIKDYADVNKPVITDLTDGNSYTFSSEAVTNSTSRFVLILRAPSVTTGIDNSEKTLTQVFVNSANQITIIAPQKSNFAIYNAVGQLIENGILNYKQNTINSKLNSGVYFVELRVNGQREIQKVIIR